MTSNQSEDARLEVGGDVRELQRQLSRMRAGSDYVPIGLAAAPGERADRAAALQQIVAEFQREMPVLEARIKEDHDQVLELVERLSQGAGSGPEGSSTNEDLPPDGPRRVDQVRRVASGTTGKSEIGTVGGFSPADVPPAEEKAGSERTSGWKANLVVTAVTVAVILVVLLVLGAV
jgi:hypothetical protein